MHSKIILTGKIILITGSARGIGAAAARLAHERGATVVLHGKTNSEPLRKLAAELDGARFITCDVADKQAVEAAVADIIEKHGRIDILVNSAGNSFPQSFLESDDQNWTDHFNVNVLGTVHFCQAVIPAMQEQGAGRIVNVASIRGHESTASNRIMAYSASKAAVANLTVSLAKEFAPQIAVNGVSPGFTATDLSSTWTEAVHRQIKTALAERPAQPAEIAEAILFLASDAASFVTGQTLVVDGGYTVSGK